MSTRHVVRLVAALSVCCAAVACTACAPDPDAIHSAPADTSPHVPPGVTRLEGSPEQLGTQHGTLLADEIKIMLGEYVGDVVGPDGLDAKMLARVRTMKPSLPEWYRRELAACAAAAGVDEGVLLYAQCEGDIRSLWGCTSYVAFGNATADGAVEMARNFDYWGLDSTQECARVFAYIPQPEDGYAFVSVGWTGILGGWTFVNEKGLFVANTLNWRLRRNPRGVPTLILERIIAQKAATVDEAIALIEANPRMRGQSLVIGHAGDPAAGVAPDAAVVTYDAVTVTVRRHTDGFAFASSIGTDPNALRAMLRRADREPTSTIRSAGKRITLHSVAVRPAEGKLWVAHGRPESAHEGDYVEYDIPALLTRRGP